MNWYEHHIKDYAAAIQFHSWDEDMAYTRMLRWYYRKEQPLPADVAEVCRKVGAASKAQKAAVQTILDDFFELREDGWHNEKADEVLAAYHAGEPDREQKKTNEDTRKKRHNEERRQMFALLNEAGEHLPWNCKTQELRDAVKRIQHGTSDAVPRTPRTAPRTPSTATHPPIPNPQSPSSVSEPAVPPAPPPSGEGGGTPGGLAEVRGPKPARKRVRKPAPKKPPAPPKPPPGEGPTVAVWRAYALAYAEVHGVEPVRNAKVSGQLSNLVARLGKDDAVHVAAFYVRACSDYRLKNHPVDLLLRDAEGLRTRWARSERAIPDPAVVARPDARTQHRIDRMGEALGHDNPAWVGSRNTVGLGARQPFDLEAEESHGPERLPAK